MACVSKVFFGCLSAEVSDGNGQGTGEVDGHLIICQAQAGAGTDLWRAQGGGTSSAVPGAQGAQVEPQQLPASLGIAASSLQLAAASFSLRLDWHLHLHCTEYPMSTYAHAHALRTLTTICSTLSNININMPHPTHFEIFRCPRLSATYPPRRDPPTLSGDNSEQLPKRPRTQASSLAGPLT